MSFFDPDEGDSFLTDMCGKYGHVWVAIVASVVAICVAAYQIARIIWG